LKHHERIERATSLAGGLVIDPFCGSGTTLVASAKLGRAFVGGDVGELAIETTARRLKSEGVPFRESLQATGEKQRPVGRLTARR
jgi:site-specific DNA-methyltransferase (adenine-specific)